MTGLSRMAILGVSFSWVLQAYADIDMSFLVKVNPANNPDCVEYYNYKGDMYCSTSPKNPPAKINPQIRHYETQAITFDDRPWQAAWGNKTDVITTVEYVPAGEDIEHWNELITSQFIPGIQDKIIPKQFMEGIIEDLTKEYKPVINIIEQQPHQVLFEFRILAPSNMQQDELQLITQGKKGFYVLHYVIKKSDMGDENRQKWIQLLKKSKIN